MGGMWPRGGALHCCRREKRRRRRRTEERREEKRDLDWSLSRSGFLFFCCNSLVFSNKKFCLWFSLAGVAQESKS